MISHGFSTTYLSHDCLNQVQACRHLNSKKHKEVGTRFELANIPFAEDSLGPLGQPTHFLTA